MEFPSNLPLKPPLVGLPSHLQYALAFVSLLMCPHENASRVTCPHQGWVAHPPSLPECPLVGMPIFSVCALRRLPSSTPPLSLSHSIVTSTLERLHHVDAPSKCTLVRLAKTLFQVTLLSVPNAHVANMFLGIACFRNRLPCQRAPHSRFHRW